MRNFLRRIAFISLGLLALSLMNPAATSLALADDCCCECCCDCCCCCDDEEPPWEPKCCKTGSPSCRWGCGIDLGQCPVPYTPGEVFCSLYTGPSSVTLTEPPLDDHHENQLNEVLAQANLDNQLVYIRLVACEGASWIASYHLIPRPTGAPLKSMMLPECGQVLGGMWRPMDPECAAPPFWY
jgi:hypothetical protein